MSMNRRKFLKTMLAVLGSAALPIDIIDKVAYAFINTPPEKRPKVAWMQNQDCTGCSISLTQAPDLLDFITSVINLRIHPNLSFASGEGYHNLWEQVIDEGNHVIIAEGSIPLGNVKTAEFMGQTGAEFAKKVFNSASIIIATGTCASFGGISGADGNLTGATPIPLFLNKYCGWSKEKIKSKVITLPGCPVHPIEIIGTVSWIVGTGQIPERNSNLSPNIYYGTLIHDHCPLRGLFEQKNFAKYPGDDGCLFEVGCKGPRTFRRTCWEKKWNNGANWCIEARSGCKGCAHPSFCQNVNDPMYTKPSDVKYIDWDSFANEGGEI